MRGTVLTWYHNLSILIPRMRSRPLGVSSLEYSRGVVPRACNAYFIVWTLEAIKTQGKHGSVRDELDDV